LESRRQFLDGRHRVAARQDHRIDGTRFHFLHRLGRAQIPASHVPFAEPGCGQQHLGVDRGARTRLTDRHHFTGKPSDRPDRAVDSHHDVQHFREQAGDNPKPRHRPLFGEGASAAVCHRREISLGKP
jgi:hypothetical protein